MSYDPNTPVLGLIIKPGDEVASFGPIAANSVGVIAATVGGRIEAIEIDGGSVLWLNEEGKNLGLPTNLLATKIAHRLNAGLYPDDTINGTAVLVGETEGPHRDLVSCDVTEATLEAMQSIGVSRTLG